MRVKRGIEEFKLIFFCSGGEGDAGGGGDGDKMRRGNVK